MNLASFRSALGVGLQAVQTATAKAQDQVREVVGNAKSLKDYVLGSQIASGGPESIWKIYAARSKKEGRGSVPLPLTHIFKSFQTAYGFLFNLCLGLYLTFSACDGNQLQLF